MVALMLAVGARRGGKETQFGYDLQFNDDDEDPFIAYLKMFL